MNTLEKEIKFLKSLKWDARIPIELRLLVATLGTEEFLSDMRNHVARYRSSMISKLSADGRPVMVACLEHPRWVDSAHRSVSHLVSYASSGVTVFGACMSAQVPGYYSQMYRQVASQTRCEACLGLQHEVTSRGAVIR